MIRLDPLMQIFMYIGTHMLGNDMEHDLKASSSPIPYILLGEFLSTSGGKASIHTAEKDTRCSLKHYYIKYMAISKGIDKCILLEYAKQQLRCKVIAPILEQSNTTKNNGKGTCSLSW